jgi:hypothetical protein
MQLVSTVTVGAGGAASIEFTGIPQTATDLLLVLSDRNDLSFSSDTTSVRIIFNSSGGTYADRILRGNGSSASSTQAGDNPIGYYQHNNFTANSFANRAVYIPNYTSSSAKSYSADSVVTSTSGSPTSSIIAGSWTGTAAITSIRIEQYSPQLFVQHTSASLYTITRA